MKILAPTLVALGILAVPACGLLLPMRTTYPNPEPNEQDERNYTLPKCDFNGLARDCYFNVHFQQRGNVTVMLAPQCAQVTVSDAPSKGDDSPRKATTFMEPNIVTVVGDRNAQMHVGLCLQFPLREPQRFIFEKPTMVIDPKGCRSSGLGAGSAADCFN